MSTMKVSMIDNELVIVLPKDIVQQLGVSVGSEFAFDKGALRPTEALAEDQLAVMKDVMVRRRDVLKRLAE